VWAAERAALYGDDEELRTGPAWLARRLAQPPLRVVGADVLTLAGREARRRLAERELDRRTWTAQLAAAAEFESRARTRLASSRG
jgi:hypothetical protein